MCSLVHILCSLFIFLHLYVCLHTRKSVCIFIYIYIHTHDTRANTHRFRCMDTPNSE